VISDGRNQIAIRFNRDLNHNEESIQTLRDSIQSTVRFDTDSIQILTIRLKRHAIWTEILKLWLKFNTHSH